MTQDDLANAYAAGTVRRTFVNWLVAGRKLLLLCAAGGLLFFCTPNISKCEVITRDHVYSAPDRRSQDEDRDYR